MKIFERYNTKILVWGVFVRGFCLGGFVRGVLSGVYVRGVLSGVYVRGDFVLEPISEPTNTLEDEVVA